MRDWFVSIKNVKNKTQIVPKMAIHVQRKEIVATGFAINKEKRQEAQRGYVGVNQLQHVKIVEDVGMKQCAVQRHVSKENVSQWKMIVFMKATNAEDPTKEIKNVANLTCVNRVLVKQENVSVQTVNVKTILAKIMKNVVKV